MQEEYKLDKIIVQPENVRGLGDVLSPKSASDFEEYLSTLTSSTDTVNGASMTVYSLEYNGSPAPTPASISLTSDKSILSYADSQSATLSATVLDADSGAIEGASVEFFKGSTSLGTADTNSSGVATKTYASTGAGDLSFTASVGSLVSETYAIEDCYVYDTSEHSRTQSGTSATSTLILNDFSFDNTHDWRVAFDLKVSANSQRVDIDPPSTPRTHHLGIGKTGSGDTAVYIGKSGTGENSYNHTSKQAISNNVYYPVVVSKSGTDVSFTLNNVSLDTYSCTWLSSWSTETLHFTQWGSGTIYIKNIKVKKL